MPFPSGFSITLWVLLLLNPNLMIGKETRSLKNQIGIMKVLVCVFANRLLFWVLPLGKSPSNCAPSMFRHILALINTTAITLPGLINGIHASPRV